MAKGGALFIRPGHYKNIYIFDFCKPVSDYHFELWPAQDQVCKRKVRRDYEEPT